MKISDFNSHAHVERDPSGISQRTFCIAISTHTLTWSVTLKLKSVKSKMKNFNSHAHVERDARTIHRRFSAEEFQLTRSRGAWPVEKFPDTLKIEFQLTRSRGAWQRSRLSLIAGNKFQLTRSRGAWPLVFIFVTAKQFISTHTLTWSVTSQKLA